MKAARRLVILSAAACLAGCASGPDYKKPELEMPAAWQSEEPFHAAAPDDGALKGNWWETFQDARLNQLEQLALEQNQTLRIAAARLEQARQQVTVSAAGLFPQVNLQTGAARQKISANRPLSAYGTPNQSTVQNNFQLGFAVNYEADLFGRVRRTVEQARASSEQAGADFENARLVLMSELAADYFNLRELDAEIDVVRQGIALQEKALEFITDRHDLGVASGLDLAQQQALLDTNRTQIELLQNQRVQYEHALATMTGTPAPQFKLEPALTLMTVNLSPLPVGLPSDLLQRRPDVASAERAMAAANAGIGIARVAYFPTILLQPNGGWDSNQIGNLLSAPSLLWSLGTSLTQNLFDAGKTRAGVKIAEASYTAAVAGYRQAVLVAMQEVEDGIDGLAVLGRAGKQSEASVHSSQRVLDLANDRYSGGLDTYLDVITAQQTLLASQRQVVQINGQRMLTSVYLVKALGGGWQAHAAQAAR
ncbi:MAG: efflux transporter outer membrane subunit [Collimonas sp.]|uniref:efflux transporter outer membrane subunit n=1 Tax=Collimonas sp. TaxID=1963772 RepID=UPI0032654DE9